MRRFFLIIVVVMVAVTSTDSFSQKRSKKEKSVTEFTPELKEQIENKEFKLTARTALPQSWRSVSLDGRYNLEIKGDSIMSNLPFYGVAYKLPYGGGDGLIFDAKIKKYSTKKGKKGSVNIEIDTTSREDTFTYHIVIHPNGSATINVNSNNRQSISFLAEIEGQSEK